MEDQIKKTFSRHIARIMEYLENSGSPDAVKKLVKTELWYLYDDTITASKEGCQDGEAM